MNPDLQGIISNFKASNPSVTSNTPTSNPSGDWYSGVKSGAFTPAGMDTTKTDTSNQDPGLITRLGSDFNSRAKDVISAVTAPSEAVQAGKSPATIAQKVGEAGLQTTGAVAGGAMDILNETLSSLTPKPIKDWLSGLMNQVSNTDQAKQIIDAWNTFATAHPSAAKDLGSVVNIAGVMGLNKAELKLTGGKGIPAVVGQEVKDLPGQVKSGAQAVSDFFSKRADGNAEKQVWDLVKPTLSKSEQAQAVTEGRIVKSGPLGTVSQVPQGRELDMINAVKPYVSGVSDPIKAVSNMQQGIADEAGKLRVGLEQSDAIWNKNTLKGAITGIDRPDQLVSDARLNNAFDLTTERVLKIADSAPKTLDGLLDVRQGLDKIVEEQYPNLYDGANTPIKTAITKVRGAINDMIENQLPEGKTADGIPFKDSLKKQSLLYDAIDNTATKAPKVGTNIVTRAATAIKKHPVISTIAGYEALKHTLP